MTDFKYKVIREANTNNVYDSAGKVVYSNTDSVKAMQYALDNLTKGRTSREKVLVIGDYTNNKSITIQSQTAFELQGNITMDKNANAEIIKLKSGTTNIEILGQGPQTVFDANRQNQSNKNVYGMRFKVTNSHFADFTIKSTTSDCFMLDVGSSGNLMENLIAKDAWNGEPPGAGENGNGLGDRGENNKWINCIAEANYSDNWVIKCRNSTFTNCIGRNSVDSVGYGFFADPAYGNIEGNSFINCQAYGNKTNGFSFNMPCKYASNSPLIRNNTLQVECFNNNIGIQLKNSTTKPSLLLTNNDLDVYLHDNNTGLYIENVGVYLSTTCTASPTQITNNKGSIVAINNKTDLDLQKGSGNNFDLYIAPGNAPIINQGDNTVNTINFDCSNIPDKYCTRAYCQEPQKKYRCSGSPDFQCIEDPNGPFNSLAECQANCIKPSAKYRCSGSPDFQCIEDPNGPFNSLAECQANCKKPSTTKFKIHKDKTKITVSESKSGNLTADEACQQTCDFLRSL